MPKNPGKDISRARHLNLVRAERPGHFYLCFKKEVILKKFS
jgi:hypothetical protein